MNIAEILKYCPKGTTLYSTIWGNIELIGVTLTESIKIKRNLTKTELLFSNDNYSVRGECVLFPSKDQRDWSKFRLPVKRGDIMMTTDKRAFITTGKVDMDGYSSAYCGINIYHTFTIGTTTDGWTASFYILASEEAKKELFDKIEEAGYRWNANTLELEKIGPKFKEGDVAVSEEGNLYLVSNTVTNIANIAAVLYIDGDFIIYDNFSIELKDLTLAIERERNRFYSALTKRGYKYNKEQHKLIKQEFKPYDKVLVRDDVKDFWKTDIYLSYVENGCYHYRCTTGHYRLCIPYEGNEYLLGTTDSPTWTDKKE